MASGTQGDNRLRDLKPFGKKRYICSVCGKEVPFCWVCKCGFQICNRCMQENLWGMTCSGVLWECPDCGEHRPF